MKILSISDFVDGLQACGRYTFTKREAKENLRLSDIALKSALRRLEKKGRIAAIRRGFYVIVPVEYRSKGILPPSWFIDDFMKFRERPCYIALLSAAAIHGAAHQQPQEFHVMTDSPQRTIGKMGLVIRFFVKSALEKTPTDLVKTETGSIRVSNPAATAFDLVRYEERIGGLERVATLLQELSEFVRGDKLLEVAKIEPVDSYAQRLGFLLEKIGEEKLASKLSIWIASRMPRRTSLKPSLATKGCRIDKRWNVLVNLDVEGEF